MLTHLVGLRCNATLENVNRLWKLFCHVLILKEEYYIIFLPWSFFAIELQTYQIHADKILVARDDVKKISEVVIYPSRSEEVEIS